MIHAGQAAHTAPPGAIERMYAPVRQPVCTSLTCSILFVFRLGLHCSLASLDQTTSYPPRCSLDAIAVPQANPFCIHECHARGSEQHRTRHLHQQHQPGLKQTVIVWSGTGATSLNLVSCPLGLPGPLQVAFRVMAVMLTFGQEGLGCRLNAACTGERYLRGM